MNWLLSFVDLTQESQTLDHVNDFFQFVTGYFGVINTSVPHIYHSALLLSPKASSVWKLYGPQATPMARVVKGIPTSWNPNIASKIYHDSVVAVAWSHCSKFVAIVDHKSPEVAILDATTLEQLHILHSKYQRAKWGGLKFSPDGHLLTSYSHRICDDNIRCIASWDLQTGGIVSHVTTEGWCESIAYSECGTMLGGYFPDSERVIIYDILSGTQIFSHPIIMEHITGDIWTYGKYLQYAIVGLRYIAIWEVSFTSSHAPIQIGTLPTPDNFPAEKPEQLVFLPTFSLLAFVVQSRVFVWDAQCQKILLDSIGGGGLSFSPDGQFFIYIVSVCEFCICKKSPDGYLPHQRLFPTPESRDFSISPDGGSIISSCAQLLQLWHINSIPSLQSIPSQDQQTQDIYLNFSPDESSIAIAGSDGAITIFDLKSGNPHMVIDTGMEIHGMGVIGSKVIVVGGEKSIIWELPAGNHTFGTRWNIDHSIQIITFEKELEYYQISISPNLDYMVGVNYRGLAISNIYTGKGCKVNSTGYLPGFTLDGDEVWCAKDDGRVEQWEIVKDEISGTIKLEYLRIMRPLVDFPWLSSCGYQITNDGWVFSSNGRRLLWLPHQWRSDQKVKRKWSERILALLYDELPEFVILELEV